MFDDYNGLKHTVRVLVMHIIDLPEDLLMSFFCSVEKQLSFTSYQKVGAFAQNRNSKEINKTDFEDVPFLNLLQPEGKSETMVKEQKDQNCSESNVQISGQKSEEDKKVLEQPLSPSESISSNTSAPDDFVMVELVSLIDKNKSCKGLLGFHHCMFTIFCKFHGIFTSEYCFSVKGFPVLASDTSNRISKLICSENSH